MANAKVYICDKCESYVPEDEVHVVEVHIAPLNKYRIAGTKAVYSGYLGATRQEALKIRREICSACAERLNESFKLGKNDDTLRRELFDNFELPAKIV